MWISKEELYTHLRSEIVQRINRNDDTMVTAAIDGAVAEAKSYLGAYNTFVIFSTKDNARHDLLLIFVKDIAVWHFINIANPACDLKLRENRYNRAIKWLESVQKGDVKPDLPKLPTTEGNPKCPILSTSNPKRTQHF